MYKIRSADESLQSSSSLFRLSTCLVLSCSPLMMFHRFCCSSLMTSGNLSSRDGTRRGSLRIGTKRHAHLDYCQQKEHSQSDSQTERHWYSNSAEQSFLSTREALAPSQDKDTQCSDYTEMHSMHNLQLFLLLFCS